MTTKRISMMLSKEEYMALKINKKLIYVADIKKTLISFNKSPHGKKAELLLKLDDIYKPVSDDIVSDVILSDVEYRGPSFDNVANITNTEDFYTFQNMAEISPDYIFTYKTDDEFIYGFDIRSFHKLIEKTNFNPYNREKISRDVIDRMNNRLNQMKYMKLELELEEDILTPEQKFNAKVLDIFQKMDDLNTIAGGTNIHWFTDLSFNSLKILYSVLEDIWNYRAELSRAKKLAIVPTNNCFTNNMSVIQTLTWSTKNNRWLQHTLLDEIDKLVSSATDDTNRSTGCYYVLIAFTEVNPLMAAEMPWLSQ